MTIFFKVLKTFIHISLSKELTEAENKDQGLAGSLRDQDLSEFQKKENTDLQGRILGCPENKTDYESLLALKKMILETDLAVQSRRSSCTPPQPRGHFNSFLLSITARLDLFYEVIKEAERQVRAQISPPIAPSGSQPNRMLPLQNQSIFLEAAESLAPLNTLYYWAIYYLGENVFFPETDGLLAWSMHALAKSSKADLRTKKEECLLYWVIQCATLLDKIRPEELRNCEAGIVLQIIEKVEEENARLCKASRPVKKVPISFILMGSAQVDAPKFQPSRGRLARCMREAREGIQANQGLLRDFVPHSA